MIFALVSKSIIVRIQFGILTYNSAQVYRTDRADINLFRTHNDYFFSDYHSRRAGKRKKINLYMLISRLIKFNTRT